MKIAVIGLGAIGSQVLWQLSQREGVTVHGFESEFPGHQGAGAGGDNRIYWNLEYDHRGYIPLVQKAADTWRDLEEKSGTELRDITGVLALGKETDESMALALESAKELGVDAERLSSSDVKKRFPQFNVFDDTLGIWDPKGGIIWPERTISTACELAETNGAEIKQFTRVEKITHEGERVFVHVGDEVFEYDRVVVAGGGWTPTLLPYMKDKIVARRLTSLWFFGENQGDLDGLPPFMVEPPFYSYGLPVAGRDAVKVGLGFNDHKVVADPSQVERHLAGDELQDQLKKFKWLKDKVLPKINDMPYRYNTYIESYSRSMLEYVDTAPDTDNVIIMTGFSGHGFRVSPAMGVIGAELALGLEPSVDISFLKEAEPVFEILDPELGTASHNRLMTSGDQQSE